MSLILPVADEWMCSWIKNGIPFGISKNVLAVFLVIENITCDHILAYFFLLKSVSHGI